MRLVPWRDWAEWEDVRAAAFDRLDPARAVPTLMVWRRRGRVPAPVLATLELLQVSQHLAGCEAPGAGPQAVGTQAVLQQALAMAIVRFVNIVLDVAQTGASARSLSALAQELRLPLWFVDLRHDATHGQQLPSYAVLRTALADALWWLNTNYWKPQREALDAVGARVESALAQRDTDALRSAIESGGDLRDFVVPALLSPGRLVPAGPYRASAMAAAHELWWPVLEALHGAFGRFLAELCAELISAIRDAGTGPARKQYCTEWVVRLAKVAEVAPLDGLPDMDELRQRLADAGSAIQVDRWVPLGSLTGIAVARPFGGGAIEDVVPGTSPLRPALFAAETSAPGGADSGTGDESDDAEGDGAGDHEPAEDAEAQRRRKVEEMRKRVKLF